MVTHKQKIEHQYHWVLTKNNEVLATYGNLKTLVEAMEESDVFAYNTLAKKNKETDFPVSSHNYTIWRVKHVTGKYSRK